MKKHKTSKSEKSSRLKKTLGARRKNTCLVGKSLLLGPKDLLCQSTMFVKVATMCTTFTHMALWLLEGGGGGQEGEGGGGGGGQSLGEMSQTRYFFLAASHLYPVEQSLHDPSHGVVTEVHDPVHKHAQNMSAFRK